MDDLTHEAWERLHALHGNDVPSAGRLVLTMGLSRLAERALQDRGEEGDYATHAEVYLGAMWEGARSDFLRFGMPHLEATLSAVEEAALSYAERSAVLADLKTYASVVAYLFQEAAHICGWDTVIADAHPLPGKLQEAGWTADVQFHPVDRDRADEDRADDAGRLRRGVDCIYALKRYRVTPQQELRSQLSPTDAVLHLNTTGDANQTWRDAFKDKARRFERVEDAQRTLRNTLSQYRHRAFVLTEMKAVYLLLGYVPTWKALPREGGVDEAPPPTFSGLEDLFGGESITQEEVRATLKAKAEIRDAWLMAELPSKGKTWEERYDWLVELCERVQEPCPYSSEVSLRNTLNRRTRRKGNR